MLNLEFIKKEADPEERAVYELYKIGAYEVVVTTYNSGYKNISIYNYGKGRFTPTISYTPEIMTGDKPEFKIQTTSYGSLTRWEMCELVTEMTNAMEVVRTLEEAFIK